MSMFSKNQSKITDIIKFPWDKEDDKGVEEPQSHMSDEERKRMEEYMIKVLNNQK